MRSLRRAARNVAVFHLPCGTLSTRSSPFGAQPRSRVTAQAIEDANARRRALELAARDARYFAERLASAVLQPEPASSTAVAFGSRVTVLRDDGRRQTFRIVGEDEADPRAGSIAYVSPLAHQLIGKKVGEAVEMDGREIELVAVE
jgi:transcription elongation GreA/GreB family factor